MDRIAGGDKLDSVEGHLELKNVHFAYPSRPDVSIFKDFSLVIPKGQTVAIVGNSGSGKSTIVSLIERFYDPNSGKCSWFRSTGLNLQAAPLHRRDRSFFLRMFSASNCRYIF